MYALIKDFQTYKLDVMGIQETHLKDTFQRILPQGVFFYSIRKPTTVSGMGFLLKHEGTLKVANDRIITLEIAQKNKKYKFIKRNAPTLPLNERDPQRSESFYDALNSTIQKKPKSQVKICIIDFNAKTESVNETKLTLTL